jgi:2-polyprenyl-3-methyl-5-hydroxy-6-metoxy-1,4-benzoquinol methylase
MTTDPTKRFTERADNYVKYRPGYPDEAIDLLQNECGLTEGSVVADIGAGTGIFTKKLLNKGYTVYAVEPNQATKITRRLMPLRKPQLYPQKVLTWLFAPRPFTGLTAPGRGLNLKGS